MAEMSIFGIGALFIGLVLFPVLALFLDENKRRKHYAEIIHKSWKFFIWVIEVTKVIGVRINGNLSDIRGKIVVASHPSLIDIILLIGQMPNSLCLAKKELLKNPIMRNIVKSLYIINDTDPEIFKKDAINALNDGYNIIIFPTGTRTQPGEIVPIKIETDYPFLIKNHSPLDAGEKTVNYNITVLPEINISEYNVENIGEIKARNHISEKIKECIN